MIALGDSTAERPVHDRPDPEAVHDVGAGPSPCPMGPSSTTSTYRPTARSSPRPSARSRASSRCACSRSIGCANGRRRARRGVRLRHGSAQRLRVLARRPLPVRQLVLHRRLEHLPLRDRDEDARRRHQHRHRILPAHSARRRRADRVPVHGDGFVPARITAAPLDDISPITFFGERLAEEHPIVKTWNVGSPARIPFDTMPQTDGHVSNSLAGCGVNPSIRSSRDTRPRLVSACGSICRIRCSSTACACRPPIHLIPACRRTSACTSPRLRAL